MYANAQRWPSFSRLLAPGQMSRNWHKQLDKQWSATASLLVSGNVVYVGRANEICSPPCKSTGSIDALKVSDGTVLWHSKIDVQNDASQLVQVQGVINGVVYVEVDGGFSSKSAGDVYAL